MLSPSHLVLRYPIRLTAILAIAFTLLVWGCCPFIDNTAGRMNLLAMVVVSPLDGSVLAVFSVGHMLAMRSRWLGWWYLFGIIPLTGNVLVFFAVRQLAAQTHGQGLADIAWFFSLVRICSCSVWIWLGAGCVIAVAGWVEHVRWRRRESRLASH